MRVICKNKITVLSTIFLMQNMHI